MDLTRTKYQWMYTSADDYEFLHYIAEISDWDDNYWDIYDIQFAEDGEGPAKKLPWKAACGLSYIFAAPGIFSRMGCPRCPACCKAIGLSKGKGCPINDKTTHLV